MKLFLFGGAETSLNQVSIELKQIEAVIRDTNAKQVFHIPFARMNPTEGSWAGDWFHKNIHLPGVEYLNARNKDDILRATNPLVFISGGSDHLVLMEKIKENADIMRIVRNAKYIIGESAGGMVLGDFVRTGRSEGQFRLFPGLGIIKDTIIEPHYTERNMQEQLSKEMIESGAKYGVGIDCLTALVFKLDEFPQKYEKIGEGNIVIKKK